MVDDSKLRVPKRLQSLLARAAHATDEKPPCGGALHYRRSWVLGRSITTSNVQPLGRGFSGVLFGATSIGILVTKTKSVLLSLRPIAVAAAIGRLATRSSLFWLGVVATPVPILRTVEERVLFDAIGIWV